MSSDVEGDLINQLLYFGEEEFKPVKSKLKNRVIFNERWEVLIKNENVAFFEVNSVCMLCLRPKLFLLIVLQLKTLRWMFLIFFF